MALEVKSLLLGLLLSVGVFALRSGIGLRYFTDTEKQKIRRLTVFPAFIWAYGLLFGISALCLAYADQTLLVQAIQTILKSGMLIHFLAAVCMLAIGMVLLKSDKHNKNWLKLAAPCPICMIFVILCTEFFMVYLPDIAARTIFSIYLSFMAIAFLSAWLSKYDFIGITETTVGTAMLTLSAYFMLSVVILPQFSDLAEIAGLASHSHDDGKSSIPAMLVFIAIHGILFVSGYLKMSERVRRSL